MNHDADARSFLMSWIGREMDDSVEVKATTKCVVVITPIGIFSAKLLGVCTKLGFGVKPESLGTAMCFYIE